LKNERVHSTRYRTRAEAEADLFDYIEPFYAPKEVPLGDNRKRIHSTLGFASPMNFLETWFSMRKNWRHNADGLEDEKQRKPQ